LAGAQSPGEKRRVLMTVSRDEIIDCPTWLIV